MLAGLLWSAGNVFGILATQVRSVLSPSHLTSKRSNNILRHWRGCCEAPATAPASVSCRCSAVFEPASDQQSPVLLIELLWSAGDERSIPVAQQFSSPVHG